MYTLSIYLVRALLPIVALFSKKIRLFVSGRKSVWATLSTHIDPQARYVWVHTASLGEFEQGLPVIKALRKQGYKVLVTFFSPSGYEVRKNTPDADIVVYLPLDTPANARNLLWLFLSNTSFGGTICRNFIRQMYQLTSFRAYSDPAKPFLSLMEALCAVVCTASLTFLSKTTSLSNC